ncbi:MAG: hypothetical protein KJZ53_03675, partial [Anaerolineales bacterium]|nr:hypothetical protein [Anaerolineales bacterium]
MKSLVNSSEVHNIGLLLLIAAWLWWLLSLQIVSMELRATTRNILLLLTAALVLLYQTSVEQRRLIGQTKALLARPVFERWGWFTVADVLVMVGILLYSVLSFMGNWQGRTGFMPLSSDPANIAT